MAYTVFFKEGKDVLMVSNFIDQQPATHRDLLQTLADELANNGHIAHPLATKNASGEWSVLVNENNGDVDLYTLFISKLEPKETNTKIEAEHPPEKRALVIVDPAGPRDSIGGYHPGYWSITQYASFLEDAQRILFLKTAEQIQKNFPSEYYSVRNDGSILIHIHKPEKAYTISVTCQAEWR